MATLREVFGAGSFAGIVCPFLSTYRIPALTQAPGGFLVFGILIAVMNKIKEKDGGVKRKSFSCESCPSAAHCKKASCGEMSEIHSPSVKEVNENDA
jgi:electron transport complex protein RnfE